MPTGLFPLLWRGGSFDPNQNRSLSILLYNPGQDREQQPQRQPAEQHLRAHVSIERALAQRLGLERKLRDYGAIRIVLRLVFDPRQAHPHPPVRAVDWLPVVL